MIYILLSLVLFMIASVYLHYLAYEKKRRFIKSNLFLLNLGLFCLIFFVEVYFLIYNKGLISDLDILINSWIRNIWNPELIGFMTFVTKFGDNLSLIFFFALLLGILIYSDLKGSKKLKKTFYFEFFVILAIGLVLDFTVKNIVDRHRPMEGLISASGPSFPSGHALMAAIFFFMLIYFFSDYIKNKSFRAVFVLACIFLTLLIGASRVYLGVHWFSDVLGGFLFGIFAGCFSIIGINFLKRKNKQA